MKKLKKKQTFVDTTVVAKNNIQYNAKSAAQFYTQHTYAHKPKLCVDVLTCRMSRM